MRQVIILDNGTKIEIDGNDAKFIGIDGSVLYDSTVASYSKPTLTVPYFFLMGAPERKKVAEWFNEVNYKVGKEKQKQREFLDRVGCALCLVKHDYYIATLEPSFDDKRVKILYKEGEPVATGIAFAEWKNKAMNFYSDGEWHSELALLEEGDLFKAYRIAMGYWTIEYVCDDSSSAGNYWSAPDATLDFEVSGAREVGGFRDGIGNTREIYQSQFGFTIVGGAYNIDSCNYSVADVFYLEDINYVNFYACGVLVIKGSTVNSK